MQITVPGQPSHSEILSKRSFKGWGVGLLVESISAFMQDLDLVPSAHMVAHSHL